MRNPVDLGKHFRLVNRGVRAEPGCLRFEVYHSQANSNVFILNEHWADQTAVDAHRKAAAYTTIYQPKVLPKVDRVPHPSDLVS